MPYLALFRFDLVGLVCGFPILELNNYVGVSGVMTVAVSVTTLIQISEWDSECCLFDYSDAEWGSGRLVWFMAKSLQDEMCWDSWAVEWATSPTNLRTVESGEDLTRSFRSWIDRAFICFRNNPSSREVPWHPLLLRRRRRTARIGRHNSRRAGAHGSRPHGRARPVAAAHLARPEQWAPRHLDSSCRSRWEPPLIMDYNFPTSVCTF